MSYSACDFMDDILRECERSFGRTMPDEDGDLGASECADCALQAITDAAADLATLRAYVEKVAATDPGARSILDGLLLPQRNVEAQS